jgi:hypothetical protein
MKGLTLPLYIALHIGPKLAIIIYNHEGPNTLLTIALHKGLYLAIVMVSHDGAPYCPYYILRYRPLHSH